MSRGLKITLGLVVAGIVALAISQARAQQPPEDGKAAGYRQLLTRANDELTTVMGQLQTVQIENGRLKAELEKLKPKAEDCPNGYTRNKDGTCEAPLPLAKP